MGGGLSWGQPVDAIFKTRLRKAHGALAAAGLATTRLGEWEQGYIVPWLQGGSVVRQDFSDLNKWQSEENCEAVGALLAGIHAVDKAWYDEVRESVMEENPNLQK